MDAHTFDRWTLALAQRPSRRATLRLLVGGLLGGLLAARGSIPAAAQTDSDQDGLLDEDEVNVYGTLPNNADTDGDTVSDGAEICNRDGIDPNCQQDRIHINPLVNEDAAAPPATCIALGGACFGSDQPCCGNDPATFGYNNVICCATDLTGGSACTDIAGVFLCPDPAAVPPTGCPEGTTNCGGTCTNLATDHGNCGACGNSCGIDANCTNSTCVFYCLPGLVDCSGTCVDLSSHAAHCGACHNPCSESGRCTGGTCAPTCFSDGTLCTEDYECCSGDCGLDEFLIAGVCV